MKTRNEKILLGVLVLILFGAANFYGYNWLAQRQGALALEEASLRADKAEAEVDLQKQDFWAQRKAWIADHQPAASEPDAAGAEVLQTVLKGARDHDLEIIEQSLSDTQNGAAGMRVAVAVKVKGSMENICRWLADLQKPADFYAIPSFSMKADADEKSMVLSLQVARYFKGGA
jgi:hypothetical protein